MEQGRNIVFIGLSGCGKTTVSRLVATALGKPWFDSDMEIEAQEGMSIARLFAAKSEAYFRQRETRCIEGLLTLQGIVLSVGGGAVLQNGELLRRNTTVIYLIRSVANILQTLEPGTRPLLADANKLYTLHEQRHALYETLCDIKIENNGVIEDAAKKILEALE